jgi:hypothetical protein
LDELLRPTRGGFLCPFKCGWFIKEYLLGHGPEGSPSINPKLGAPQSDIFKHYKLALMKATALDGATRTEEKGLKSNTASSTPKYRSPD